MAKPLRLILLIVLASLGGHFAEGQTPRKPVLPHWIEEARADIEAHSDAVLTLALIGGSPELNHWIFILSITNSSTQPLKIALDALGRKLPILDVKKNGVRLPSWVSEDDLRIGQMEPFLTLPPGKNLVFAIPVPVGMYFRIGDPPGTYTFAWLFHREATVTFDWSATGAIKLHERDGGEGAKKNGKKRRR